MSSVHNPNFDVAERDCKLTGRLRRENYDSADDDAVDVLVRIPGRVAFFATTGLGRGLGDK